MKVILMLLTLIVTSCYLFPFELKVLPGVNTKMLLAVWGAIVLVYRGLRERSFTIDWNFLYLLLTATLVSWIGFFSTTYNNTSDYAYTTYIVSAVVWLSAAYGVCAFIRQTHVTCSFR